MDFVSPVVAAAIAFIAGWLAASQQHRLYREPDFRENPASGRRALLFRAGAGTAAAIVAAFAFRPDHYDTLPATLTAVFGLVFIILASTDFERRRIPNNLSYPAMAAAAAVCWAWPDRDPLDIALGFAAAALAGGLLFAIGIAVGRGGIGFGLGDVKLMLLMGLVLGWPFVVSAIIYGILLAGIPAIVLMVMGRGREKYAYGPYLSLGALLLMLFPSISAY